MDWNVNADIMKVLDMLGIPMPGGNGGVLRQIAQQWDDMATAVEAQITALDQAVAAVVPSDWTGEAADGFRRHWKTQSQEVSNGVANFRTVAKGLSSYADTVDSINEEILGIAEQILAASAVGAVLTIVTAGISDAIAAAADAVEVARITTLVAKFTELAEEIGVDLEKVAEVVEQLLAKIKELIEFLKSTKYGRMAINVGTTVATKFTGNFIADTGANVASQYLSGQKVTWGDDVKNGGLDALGTVLTEGVVGEAAPGLAGMEKTMAGLSNVGGGIFQSEVGGLAGVNGDTAFENPFTRAGLAQDVENLEGAGADGLGGALAAGKDTAENGRVFSITDTLGNLTTGVEQSGTGLKRTLSSFEGRGGAIPVGG
ncbi:MAG TPA: WXG100 family type VII secretion target [Actinospica sp.]|nr:WXG100 family type VII secretion target [Actinospica sp.]